MRSATVRWTAPPLTAAAMAAAYLLLRPESGDIAAHAFRTWLFRHDGFVLWNAQWYGGHAVPGYSILFPPLAAALGPRVIGSLAAIVAAALFAALVRSRWGERTWPAAVWFGVGTATLLFTGRLPFALGVALGLGSLLALQRGRVAWAASLAACTALASPVAAAFVALAGAALLLRSDRFGGAVLLAGSVAPALVLGLAFPQGGAEPYGAKSLWPILICCATALVLLPRRERELRDGAVLYALASVALFLVPTPVGSNIARLGALTAGPLLAAALLAHGLPRRAHLAVALGAVAFLAGWQWANTARDLAVARADPSSRPGYFKPLVGFLSRQPGPVGRVEIPFTRLHMEAFVVATRFPIARGWERQVDHQVNALFYRRRLSPERYRRWLHAMAVRWVALPDAPLDWSARAEARLLRSGLPFLKPVWHGRHWRVWEVRDATPIVRGAVRLDSYRPDRLRLQATHAGRALLQVRWTPYWTLMPDAGCLAPTPDGWTELRVARPGPVTLTTSLDPDAGTSGGVRCRSDAGR